ncbi:MAG: hypothetical protein P4L84_14295 [Isosphaeraceae bacterium]|nr:hypothetical protein [Isosphaeraceae bacterium]
MRTLGVCYDAGVVKDIPWRPSLDAQTARREMEIIRHDLHCTAVCVVARDIGRLEMATGAALEAGLDVWLSPAVWDRDADGTIAATVRAARAAERLRSTARERITFQVGGELTLFMRGILPGRTLNARLKNMMASGAIRSGAHNQPLNTVLARLEAAVRPVFGGALTYASLPWEQVDWSRFDIVGVDHYRAARIKDRYVEMLAPLLATGKPVVITEFGNPSCEGGDEMSALSTNPNIDPISFVLHALPGVGRLVRPRVSRVIPRDEALQARELTETLTILDGAGVEGAFVSTFIFAIRPYDPDPRYDLDACSPGLVRPLIRGRHGTTYPDMPWEPKVSFRAVADYYASPSPSPRSL